jgi:ribosomal protein S14
MTLGKIFSRNWHSALRLYKRKTMLYRQINLCRIRIRKTVQNATETDAFKN